MRSVGISLSVWLCALSVTSAWAAAPVIERVDVESVRYSGTVSVRVSDADGVDDLASVTIVDPYGRVTIITPESGGAIQWIVEGPNTILATSIEGYYEEEGLSFLITAADLGGLEDSLTAPCAPPVPETPPEIVYPDPDFGLIFETVPTFAWTGCQPGAENSLSLRREFDGDTDIWSYDAGHATSAVYNVDATATQPELSPGYTYHLDLTSRTCVDCGLTDPRVYVSVVDQVEGTFVVYSQDPVVEAMGFYRVIRADCGAWILSVEDVCVVVTDGDGAEDIMSLTITYPDGAAHTITPASGYWEQQGRHTVAACRFSRVYMPEEPPPVGVYTLLAQDTQGHQGQKATPWLDFWPELQMLTPLPDSVIQDNTPTFSWDTGTEEAATEIKLYQESSTTPIWQLPPTAATQAGYNSNGSASQPELTPGRTYLCDFRASKSDLPTGDPDVDMSILQITRARFTLFGPRPPLPDLPGRLAYELVLLSGLWDWNSTTNSVLLYDPDPQVRRWLGPLQAWNPDWSPDAQNLVYCKDGQLFIDSLDGAPPVAIPGQAGRDTQWSPDGNHIVYATGGSYDDLWITDLSGAQAYPLVAEPLVQDRYPSWSPDGRWVAYRRTPDDLGQSLWIVRADASDAHAVHATGVDGYPDHEVTSMGEAAWSPVGGRIAVHFESASPGGETMSGIGAISPEGGMLAPIFIAPPGVVCCAAPHFPCWSPDATQIAFASAHHLPVDEEWPLGKFESGSELWLMSADGSGEPVRLTYDHSFNFTMSWRAYHTFSDVAASHWAAHEIDACLRAGIVSGYDDGCYRPGCLLSRDQMAVYISRSTCTPTGETGMADYVPPPTPSFRDVPTDHWAYKYIEYCVANGIARGLRPDIYGPAVTVDRAQMAVFISRAVAGGDENVPDGPTAATFDDVPADHWAYKYVEYCVDNDIVGGYDPVTYAPGIAVTRDQMAVYICRAFRLPT